MHRKNVVRLFSVLLVSVALLAPFGAAAAESNLTVLFLGDDGHHRPADRFAQIAPVMAARGIDLRYTDDMDDLRAATLGRYDALVVYANIDRIAPAQAHALLDYVASGGGFVPLHCASYCFRNSDEVVALMGGQFQRHETGIFRTTVVAPEHPIMKNVLEFETWDETYVHTKHNPDRTVLQTRREGARQEPWTWVRTHGKGRVFYTAYGHDNRTWEQPGFCALVERGIRWAAGRDVFDHALRTKAGLPPFRYTAAKLPNYLSGRAWGTQGEPIGRMQLPVSPAESARHLVMPDGFEAKLFAAEPDIVKPICMTWDHRGRLWIAETTDYPNELQAPARGRDRIKICEDTDGDGRADTFTVFADKLSIPTSLCFVNGGLIVHQIPHTLFLKDTDGDDRADVREILFTGWGTRDTHAGPSNMKYGFDNWIWGMVGYSGFDATIGGERHRFNQGFYRFKPDGSKMEFVRNTNNNSWGVGFTEEGLLFGSTANRNPSVYMPIANRYYESVRGWSASRLENSAPSARFYPITDKVRQVDHHGNFTAGAGHAFYTARRFPRDYWNRAAFIAGPTGHLLATFTFVPRGSDFVAYNAWNLLASDDEWTAPTMAEVGPDGAVWMIDWYNYIVQHNPTPRGFRTGKGNAYETDLRDKTHGRIYRLLPTDATPLAPMRLDPDNADQLVAALKNDNLFWRRNAQRLLVERGKQDVVPALLELVRDTSVDAIGLNPGAIHALWTLHGLGALDGSNRPATAAAVAALQHPSAGVRRNALQVLPAVPAVVGAVLTAGSLRDDDAQVRLAAFLALADLPRSDAAGSAIAAALDLPVNARDRWIPHAATSAAAKHDAAFLRAVTVRNVSGPTQAVVAEVVARVAEHYARGGPADRVGSLITAMAEADGNLADAVIRGLSAGWPDDTPVRLDETVERAMLRLLSRVGATTKGPFVALANRWEVKSFNKYTAEIAADLLAAAQDTDQSDAERLTAARQLVVFQSKSEAVPGQLLALVTPRVAPAFAGALLDALAASESPAVATAVIDAFPRLTPSVKQRGLALLTQRPEWTRQLLSGAEDGELDLGLLALDQKQALAAHPNRRLAARARRLFARGTGRPSPDRQAVLDKLMPLAQRSGNVARGKVVFAEQCAKCHVHSGEGTAIGPDLTGMAVHSKEELLTQILDPNRSVEGNYRQYSVMTNDGRVLTGLLASETRTSIELFDTEGKKHVILRENIEQLVASDNSLMPEGFEQQVPPEDITHLLAFLTQRGKYLPLPLGKAATIVSTRGMFYNENAGAERLIFSDWSPKEFNGVPFHLVDPQGTRVPNVVMLYGPTGTFPPRMPRSVSVPCNAAARAIHLLSGVSGWGAQSADVRPTVSVVVRLVYADGETEDHELLNGRHFADYIGRFDVPDSTFAFKLRNQQIRYLAIQPKRAAVIEEIEFRKGRDNTAPVVMAVTVELR